MTLTTIFVMIQTVEKKFQKVSTKRCRPRTFAQSKKVKNDSFLRLNIFAVINVTSKQFVASVNGTAGLVVAVVVDDTIKSQQSPWAVKIKNEVNPTFKDSENDFYCMK
jgi:hypothetical protein